MKTTKIIFTVLFTYLLQLLPVYGDGDDLLQCMKIPKASANDLDENLETLMKLKEVQQRFTELHTKRETDLMATNVQTLVDAITSKNVAKLKKIFSIFIQSYHSSVVDSIFVQAINEIVAKNQLLLLADLLSLIDVKLDTKLFEIMLHAPLQVYSSVSNGNRTDEYEFLQNLSYILHKLRKVNTDAKMSRSLKSNVDNLINVLPNKFKLLFFKKHFCLENVEYSRLIYSSVKQHLSNKRNIWLLNGLMDSQSYIKAEFKEVSLTGEKKLKVTLQATESQAYYALNQLHTVVGSRENSNNLWDIKYLTNDDVIFSQDDYKMCAADSNGKGQRYIRGRKGAVSKISRCQWRVVDCNFN